MYTENLKSDFRSATAVDNETVKSVNQLLNQLVKSSMNDLKSKQEVSRA